MTLSRDLPIITGMEEHGSGHLTGCVALVTGAGRGIGRAVATSLAAAGATVAVNDVDTDVAEGTAQLITDEGGCAFTADTSIDDPASCIALIQHVEDRAGPIDILVNNAGMASVGQPVHRTDLDEIQRLLRTHLLGPFTLCRSVVPSMRARGGGNIVMISSQVTLHHPANSAPYTMAKAAMEALAMTLANENRGHRIRVNVVAPGFVDTRLGRMITARLKSTKRPTDIALADELVHVNDVAATVRFLVTDAGRGITGQRIGVENPGGARDTTQR